MLVRLTLSLMLPISALAPAAGPLVWPPRVRIENGTFAVLSTPFKLRGIAYSNVPSGRAPGPYMPAVPCLYARDFPLIAALGANAIRTYELVPEADRTFLAALDASRLYWLAGFPLERYYDAAISLSAQRERILADFRSYAARFRGERRLIAYVFGNDVAAGYDQKFSGPVEDFYALLADAAQVLRETDPDGAMLTTAVSEERELERQAPQGLDFWSWNAAGRGTLARSLDNVQRSASRPVLVSEYGIDAFDQQGRRENEQAQAAVADEVGRSIESAPWLLGGVYFGFVDEWWRGSDPARQLDTGVESPGSPDGFRNDAWFGIFRAEPAASEGLDSLSPRAVYYRLAGLWGGTYPAAFREGKAPYLAAPAADPRQTLTPGSLLRLSGSELLHTATPFEDESWPLSLGTSCLCVGPAPARLSFLSPRVVSAQIPPGLEAGERALVFFRAGRASNALPVRIERLSAGTHAGPVLEARRR